MFERIRAYRKLNKHIKFMKGMKRMAERTDNEEILKTVNETLYLQEIIKRKMWKNRKMAVSYNLNCIRKGLPF